VGCNNLLAQLDDVIAHPEDKNGMGSFGEAVAEVLLHDVLGQDIVVDEAARAQPQGVDLVTWNPADQKIYTVEVKTTASERNTGPRMTRATRQMSDQWAADRTAKAGLDQVAEPDVREGYVGKMVVQVDVGRDTVSIHIVDHEGKVDRTGASTTIGLTDLARFSDAINGT
jgi:hypothetical protein